jgi:uncharacterized protein
MITNLVPGSALITGASSGIGAAFARTLAAAGCQLILVARRRDRLEALATAIRQQYGVRVEVLAADLTQSEAVACVEESLRGIEDLVLLVNNAGFGAGGIYYQIDPVKQMNMIQLHVLATARLTRAVLPSLVARGRGAVINVASIAAYASFPKNAMYGATKAWMVSFSRSVAGEVRGTGVRVQALCPGFTRTEFHDTPELNNFNRAALPAFFWMSPDAVVSASLRSLERDQVVCIPGLVNKIMVAFLRWRAGEALARYLARQG